MAKVIVTGANGFIGKALCDWLVDAGHAVTGTVRAPDRAASNARYKFAIVGDVHGGTDWRRGLADSDVIIHLAAQTGRAVNSRDAAALKRVNVDGTEALARQSAVMGVRRLVYVSSIKVSGEHTRERPFASHDRPAPQDAYASSKLEAEQALRRAANETGLEIVIVRPPLVYGPGVKGNFLRLMQVVDRGLPLPVGSINNLRSLIAIDNLADFLGVCMDHAAAAGRTFPVADGEDLSTPELMRRIAVAMNRPFRAWPLPPTLLRVAANTAGKGQWFERLCGSLQVSNDAACEQLGWRPPQTVDEMLLCTVEWYRRTKTRRLGVQ